MTPTSDRADAGDGQPAKAKLLLIAVFVWAVLLVGVWVVHFSQIEAIEKVQMAELHTDGSNLTKLNAAHAVSALERLERVMRFFADRRTIDSTLFELIQATMVKVHSGHEMVARFGVTDAQGVLRFASVPALQGMNLSDRAHFQTHRSQASGKLLISDPVQDPMSGLWVIPLTLRLNRADGVFDGMVITWVPLRFFTRQYGLVDLPPDSVQIIAKLDGVILARLRGSDEVPGHLRSTKRILEDIAAGNTEGHLTTNSQSDGVERVYHYRVVPGYPLLVMVGMATKEMQDATAPSRAALRMQSVALSVLLSLIVGIALVYGLRQRSKLEAGARLAEMLLGNEERWNLALQGSGSVMWDWTVGNDQIVLVASGKSKDDPLRKMSFSMRDWVGMIHPQDRDGVQTRFAEHLKGKTESFEVELRHRLDDQAYRWYAVHGYGRKEGQQRVQRMVGYARDITVHRAARLEAQERTAQLDAVFQLSTDGFVTFDAELKVKFVNRAFEVITGLFMDNVAGLPDTELVRTLQTRCSPTHVFPSLAKLREMMQGDGPEDSILVELAQPRRRVLRVSMREASADTVSQIIFLRDVTDIVAVDEMKSEFLAMAAHELRTPMTSIMGFAELLSTRTLSNEQRDEFHDIILSQSQRITQILDELLDLARIEARKGQDFHIVRINLKTVVQEVVASLNVPANREAPYIDVPDLYCRADQGKAMQVFLNILSNAYKYSAAKGGPVHVTAAPLGPLEVGRYVGLRVTDHGQGMAPKDLERVFERFFRADKSGSTPGTGLGMSIVKEIMGILGGQVRVDSVEGEGTSVTLLFASECGQGPQCDVCSPDVVCPQVES